MGTVQTVAPGERRIGASILAVVAGFLTTAVASTAVDAILHATRVYPPAGERMADGLFVLALSYRAVATVGGGWVTARLAPNQPMKHAVFLAGVGTLAGLAGVGVSLAHPELGPLWYSVLIVVTAIPCVFAGAWIRL
jgi:hypothetical protein